MSKAHVRKIYWVNPAVSVLERVLKVVKWWYKPPTELPPGI